MNEYILGVLIEYDALSFNSVTIYNENWAGKKSRKMPLKKKV